MTKVKKKEDVVLYGADQEELKKKKAQKVTIEDLMSMDEKIWSEIDYITGKIRQLEDMVRRIQGRMGIE